MIAFLVGLVFAAAVVAAARVVGVDRDAAFYPTVLVVIALLYVLFAVEDGRAGVIAVEVGVAAAFLASAVLGYTRTAWWLVAGYALHGVYDILHGGVATNAGVPTWWGPFCLGIDGAIALYLIGLARRPARDPRADQATSPED
ncbi:MAG: hypothetical protein AAFQ43_04580 [Bacteroidota bacterium]